MANSRPGACRSAVLWAVVLWTCACAGCNQPGVDLGNIFGEHAAAPDADAERIARDPQAFIMDTLQRSQELKAYAVDFWRQERRKGLFGSSLSNEEHMRVKYRAEPLSIHMALSAPSTFSRIAYVAGQNDDKLRCQWRKALLGGTPPINDYDPMSAVQFGFSRSPVTDFGIGRLMTLITDTMQKTTADGHPPTITYHGLTTLEQEQLPVHHIELRYAPETELPRLKVDLLVHADHGLPAGCLLWLADGELDAKYVYTSFDTAPQFSAGDFVIE